MKWTRAVLAAVIGAIAFTVASAQTGGLRIRVIDASDKSALPGATVTISSTQSFITPTAVLTDKDGYALFPVLRPGDGYVLEVMMDGFQRVKLPPIHVKSGNQDYGIALTPEQIEKVEVVGKRQNINLEESETSTRFSEEFLADLPVQGRYYQNMLTLAPGVQDSDGDGNPNVQGSRSRDFKATVSGISNQDPLTGEWLSFVNADSIEEMEVITAGAGAEYGRAQGGFGTILQKQGSNDFEGSFNFTYRSSKIDGGGASNLPAERIPNFDWFQPSIIVSGPIIRDKLWYRLSHQYDNIDNPVNTGGGLAVSTRTQQTNDDQITWQVSPKNKLAFQYRADPLKITNNGLNSLTPADTTYTFESGGPTYVLSWDAPYSTKLLVHSQIAYQDSKTNLTPTSSGLNNNCVDPIQSPGQASAQCFDVANGLTSGSYFQTWKQTVERFTALSQATLYGGRLWGMSHQFKFGFSVENERYFRDLDRNAAGAFFLVGQEDGGTGGTPTKIYVLSLNYSIPQATTATVKGTSWGVYVEDQVKPLSNLTATVGLRLDREALDSKGLLPFDPEAQRLAYLDAAPNTDSPERLVQTSFTAYEDYVGLADELGRQLGDPDFVFGVSTAQAGFWNTTRRPGNINIVNTNMSPRLAVSWDPWNDQKTKFSLTGGRYYDKTFLAVPAVELEPLNVPINIQYVVDGNSFVPRGGGLTDVNPALSFSFVDRNLRTPYKDEYTLSVERALPWPETTVKLTYVRNKFRDQFQDIDINKTTGDYGRCVLQLVHTNDYLVESPGTGTVQGLVNQNGQYLYVTYQDTDPGNGDGRLDDCGGAVLPEPKDFGGGGRGIIDPTGQQFVNRPDNVIDLYAEDPAFGSIYLIGNYNTSDYKAYILELVRRQFRGWQLQGSYTWSKGIGDAEDYNLFLGNDRSTLADERGYLGYDQRHVVKMNATTITPWNFRLGFAVSWQSGLPYSLFRRALSTNQIPPLYPNVADQDPSARILYPTHQRNDQRNPGYWNFDMSYIKEMNLAHGLNLQLRANVYNLLNDDTVQVIANVNGTNAAIRRFGRYWELGMKLAF